MRVLITYEIPYPRVDGVSNMLFHLYPYFRENNVEVMLLFPRGKTNASRPSLNYPAIQLTGLSIPFYQDCTFGLPGRVPVKLKREFAPDLVHALSPLGLSSTIIEWAKKQHIPVIGTFTTNIPEYTPYYGVGIIKPLAWKIYQLIHNRCNLNLAPSKSIKREMETHGIVHTALWGRGVDAGRFTPDKRSDMIRFHLTAGHPERRILLCVGRLAREKNFRILHQALSGVRDIHIVFVGDGPERKNLQDLFSDHNSTFTGFLEREDLAAVYASADLLVCPSLTEGFANVVLEAFSSGIPVVGFESNGVADLVSASGAGLLATPGSSLDLREKTLALAENSSLRNELGQVGREYALTKTWSSCFDELMIYYRKVFN